MSGSTPGVIDFTYIPPNIRVPLFYAEFDNTQAGVSQPVQRTLLIGQTVSAVPAQLTYAASLAAVESLCGASSQIANMVDAYRVNDPVGELWILPLADGGGSTAATGTIVVTGPATANGTLFLMIGGYQISVGVSTGDTATVIAANIAAAVNSSILANGCPVSATSSTGTVTLTAWNKGTVGNDIPVFLNYYGAQGGQTTPAGVSVTITALAGGATDPTLTTIAALLGTQAFDFIVNPYCNSTALGFTAAMMSDQAGRWSYSNELFGHVFTAQRATAAALLTLGAMFNDQHLSILGVPSTSPTPGWVWAAAYVGAIAPSLKADPARPVQTLPVAGVFPPQPGNDFGFTNRQSLLTTGIAVAAGHQDGSVTMVRCVTTYQLNKYGQPDQSYLDVETMFTLMAVVRALKSAVTNQFPRAKLADNGTRVGGGQVVVTPSIARAFIISVYGQLEDQGLVEDTETFTLGLIVQRNANDPTRLDVLFDPYLVSGLRIFAVLTQFHLAAQASA